MSRSKVFRAKTVKDGVAMVKAEFGENALILSTRHITTTFGAKRIEMTAAPELSSSRPPKPEPKSIGLKNSRLYHWLRARDIAESAAAHIASKVMAQRGLSPEHALVEAVSDYVRVGQKRQGREVLMFVGPTGVGKTTTLAKLAARDALMNHRNVLWITTDTYRVGALAQSQRYAELIGIDVCVASKPSEVAKIIDEHGDKDTVLIDTAGRAQSDREALSALHSISQIGRIETLLCLPASLRSSELASVSKYFSIADPKGVIITKEDESVLPSALVNVRAITQLPIFWLTDGQRVPEDMREAIPEQIARHLVRSWYAIPDSSLPSWKAAVA